MKTELHDLTPFKLQTAHSNTFDIKSISLGLGLGICDTPTERCERPRTDHGVMALNT